MTQSRRILWFAVSSAMLVLFPDIVAAQSTLSPPLSSPIPLAQRTGINESYGRLPLSFEANQGQSNSQVKFLSRSGGKTLFLTSSEAVLAANSGKAVRMKLVGANPNAQIVGLEKLPGNTHYFLGNDPAKWHTNVPMYAKVRYSGIYPGVDLIYYGSQRELEYDFVVAPGADPEQIRLAIRGAKQVSLDARGDAVLESPSGEIRLHCPHLYQDSPGKRTEVAGNFALKGDELRFHVGKYDRSRALVIDPQLSYSTYLGGFGRDQGTAIAVDAVGNAYVAGTTTSPNFPTTAGSWEPTPDVNSAAGNVFITKLDPTGSSLVYSTYLGGTGTELLKGMALDISGNVFVTGFTVSDDFPTTPGALQRSFQQAFVTKLNASGSALLYSTYLGGCGGPLATAIAVDSAGSAYVAGSVNLVNDPCYPTTLGAFQRTNLDPSHADVGFVSRLHPTGSFLVYSTFVNGMEMEAIALDGSGNAYLTGTVDNSRTFSTTPGAFLTVPTGDIFVSVLNPSGSGLNYSTYLGGGGGHGNAIAVDGIGNAYFTGDSDRSYPTTPGAFQSAAGNAFVTELNPTGSALLYSTFIGGDTGSAIALDSSGNAYVTGVVSLPTLAPTPGAFQSTLHGPSDAFATVVNPAGPALVYSTYLGGSSIENANQNTGGIAVDGAGNFYVTGQTASTDFPVTPGAFQTNLALPPFCAPFCNSENAFITKFSPAVSFNTPASNPPGAPVLVSLNSNAIQVTFLGGVTKSGQTTATSLGASCPGAPGAFQFGSPAVCYDITTTAAYSAPVQVCITDPSVTSSSVLLHFTSTGWNPLSTTVTNQTICGTDTALSPFAIARRSQVPLTITANDVSRQYGSPDPTPFGVSYSGFVNGDTPAVLSGMLKCTSTDSVTSPVGTYSINCSGLTSSTYLITFAPGTLTVTPAPLTITANNIIKILNAPNPALTWTASGFVNGETTSVLTANPTCITIAAANSPVGSYPITCSGAAAANYSFTYVSGALKIQYSISIGHVIQPPINADGSSVFNQGRTVPAKFNVYDANGVAVSTPGVVSSFFLTAIVTGTVTATVGNIVDTNNPDTAFRWDGQEWIFNITTAKLSAGSTYIYTITLNDGSSILFQYGLH